MRLRISFAPFLLVILSAFMLLLSSTQLQAKEEVPLTAQAHSENVESEEALSPLTSGQPVIDTANQPESTCDDGLVPDGVGDGAVSYADPAMTADYVREAICAAYLRNEGLLGNPTGDLHKQDNYQVQDFESNEPDLSAIIIFNPLVRTAFVVRDKIWKHYDGLGGVSSTLGGPVTDQMEYEWDKFYYPIHFFMKGFVRLNLDGEASVTMYDNIPLGRLDTTFRDVPKDYLFYKYIINIEKEQITSGCYEDDEGNRFFCPERFITREELALFVARAIHGSFIPPMDYPFSDEDQTSSDEFARAIAYLAYDENEDDDVKPIIRGYTDGTFRPQNKITRAEAMSIIMRALMYPLDIPGPKDTVSFSDVKDDNKHKDAILVAAEFDIVNGYSDRTFRPDNPVTRGRVAKMLCNAFLSSGGCGSSLQERRGWSYVAPGIKWRTPFEYEQGDDIKREKESNIAIVDLEVSGIHVELAHHFKNKNSGQFHLKNIYDLVKDSGAEQSEERFYPFVSINGTAFECDGTVATKPFNSGFPWFTDLGKYSESILGINHTAYGPEQPSTKDHSVGGWWAGFFFYDADTNIASIHSPRKEPGFPYEHPEDDPDSSRRQEAQDYIMGKIGISDFAVGYEKVILYNGITSTVGTKVGDKHKTAIGIGNRGARGTDKARYLFLATAHKSVKLSDFANQLKEAGARYAILLDGGDSSQFLSNGRNGTKYNDIRERFGPCDWSTIHPRQVMNSIVVYNDSIIPERKKLIYPDGGTFSLDPNIEVKFADNSFNEGRMTSGPTADYVTLHYAQQPQPISTTLLQDIGVFYELHASHQDDSPANPQKPYTLTISYDPQRLPGRVAEANLAFYFWNGSEWEREPTSIVNADEDRVIATPNKFGSWAVFAPASLEQLTTNSPSYAGPHNEPSKIIIRVTKPALSLTKDDFSVTVDGRAASIITFYEGSDEYVLEVLPPTQSANGLYDLDVSVTAGGITLSDVEQDAVLYSESNNIDVTLVIDRSGSMSSFGFMQSAKNAAKQFVDFMFDGDQVGVVSFSNSARVDFGLAPVTSGAGGNREQAKNAIDALTSRGGTSIGGGLQQGQNELTSKGAATHPWAMVLLSDGEQNAEPLVADVLPDIVTTKTIVHTVALGSQSDQALLLDIATQTGGTYNLAPTAEQLQEVYNTIAGTVSGQQALLTQTGIVKAGETDEKSVVIDSTISEATFSVRWSNSASNLELELTAPDGTVINPTVSASTSDMLYVSGSTYAYYRIKSPTLSAGVWKMEITGGTISGNRAPIHIADPEEQYTAEVTGQPTGAAVTINSYFDDGTTYQTDDPILVSITLSDDQPILGAEAVAIVGPLLTGSSPTRTIDEQTDPILVLYDDGAHGDGQANDGVYANVLTGDNTETPGLYTFQIFAAGTANNGETFARRTQQNVNVGVSQNTISANRQAEALNLFLPLITR